LQKKVRFMIVYLRSTTLSGNPFPCQHRDLHCNCILGPNEFEHMAII